MKLMFLEPPKGFWFIMGQYVRSQYKTMKLDNTGVYAYRHNPLIIAYSLLPAGVGLMSPSSGMTAPFLFPHPGSLIRALSSSLNGRRAQLLFISISLAGLMILTRLPFIDGVLPISLPFQKEVTGTLFIAIYILGLVAAVSPRSLRGLGHGSSSSKMVGHHPDCERFRDHIVWFNGHPFCAGCSGLALGALIGIIGSVLYFFLGVPLFMPEVVFWLGVVSVALGLIQHFIDLDSPHVHLLLNVALVSGSFMLASSIDAMGASFYVEVYLLGLVIFWVATRIRVSQEEHLLVCSACSKECGRGFRATH
jgi:hypothetical protein